MNRVGMRTAKSGQNPTPADVEFLRGARVRQGFNLQARADGGNYAVADQQCAGFDEAKVGKGFAAARNAPAKRQQLRCTSDKQVGQFASIMPQVERPLAGAVNTQSRSLAMPCQRSPDTP